MNSTRQHFSNIVWEWMGAVDLGGGGGGGIRPNHKKMFVFLIGVKKFTKSSGREVRGVGQVVWCGEVRYVGLS